MVKNRYFALSIVVFTKICLAAGNIWAKDVFASMPATTFLGASLLLAIAAVWFYTFIIKKERFPIQYLTPKVWSYLVQIGICVFVLGSLSTFSLSYMNATTNAFLQNLVSLFTIVFSVLMLGEKPNRWQLIGAGVVLLGVYIFFPTRPQGSEFVGILMVLVATISMAYYNNLSRKLALLTGDTISNNFITANTILIGGSIAVLICFSLSGWNLQIPSAKAWGSIVFFGIVVRAMGMILWNLVLRSIRSYEASLAGTTYVIWGTLFSVWLLSETVVPRQWLGIAVLILGLILVQIRPKTEAAAHPATESESPIPVPAPSDNP